MKSNALKQTFLTAPRTTKQLLAVLLDVVLCGASVWIAYGLRFESTLPWTTAETWLLGVGVCLALPLFTVMGLYRAIFRYAGLQVVFTLNKAIAIYTLFYALIFTVVGVEGVPRSLGLMQPLLFGFGVMSSRLWVRYWLGGTNKSRRVADLPKVLVYGAGSAGRQLASGLLASPELHLVGYVDDDDRLHGHVLNGLPIYGPQTLQDMVSAKRVTHIYLALPSVSRRRRNEILNALLPLHVQVRTLPGLMDLTNGKVVVSDLRELDIVDLLGRDPVPPNPLMLAKNINRKVVMVTGAGGSIGSELCRQIIKMQPKALLLLEHNEFGLYAIHQELERFIVDELVEGVTLMPLLANVRDVGRMSQIFRTWKPDTVYHAAAYKHVPLVEHNPAEGIRNNVIGTLVTAQQAALHGVSDFVLVSTDKAVRPTNIMGASKRLAEMVLQALAAETLAKGGKTRFAMVRFGNVLGSSGSVVPLFRKQIQAGGPITLTDVRITRYFMTIPEAAQLVIQAGAMAAGGDVFVLHMGNSVQIIDLARRMVELSGLTLQDDANPDGDIAIKVTGLRPGEKLYEELLIGDDPRPTQHPCIMKAHEEFLPWDELQVKLFVLGQALDANDVPAVRILLKELVPGYQPDGDVVDWVWVENEKLAV
jgi:FlaA1/EpsC-like NDP-sugar epimerase